MKKILGVICLLTFTLVIGCKENEPKLDEAFGIKFGSDIEDVKKVLNKKGEYQAFDTMLLTENAPNPNPNFSNYTIMFYGKVYDISATTKRNLTEKESSDLFLKIENELFKKYGQQTQDTSHQKVSESFNVIKISTWEVGKDMILLGQGFEDNGKYQVYVNYRSVNTENILEKEFNSKGL